MRAAVRDRAKDRVDAYLRVVHHKCPGCARGFDGEAAFLAFMQHLDASVACKHEFEEYLDTVRGDAGGA